MAQQGQAGFQSITFTFRAQTSVRSKLADLYTAIQVERNVRDYADEVNQAVWKEVSKNDWAAKRNVPATLDRLELDIDDEQRKTLENQYIQDIKNAANTIANAAQHTANQIPPLMGIEQNTPSTVEARVRRTRDVRKTGKKLEQLPEGEAGPLEENLAGEMISKLNQQSTFVAEKIEKELQGLLPPYLTVKAEVSFLSGSLIMAGTIMLLDWVGTMALQSTKEALEEQFGDAVKIVVKRVFTQVLEITNLARFVDPLDKFAINTQPSAQLGSSAPSVKMDDPQTPADVRSEKRDMTRIDSLTPQIIQWLILILVLVILFNNLFTVSLR